MLWFCIAYGQEKSVPMLPILLLSPMQDIANLAPAVADDLGISIYFETSDDDGAAEAVGRHPEI